MFVQKDKMMEEDLQQLPKDAYVVGLDIGTTKISVMIGRKNEYGKLEILGNGRAVSNGVARGIVCVVINRNTIIF